MRIREQWRRYRLGRALTVVTAALALLLLILFLVLVLRGQTTPTGPRSGLSPVANSATS
ncbi:hypothetical protein [Streptomyces iconiensis]|uniref:Uncharacterized protein n=1 Tax=Streptomyces iconiensis TaxID=1384038 RepID=A0ABT6ZU74_9ACTN|nr:hypothetical protein [Streptomyces iconiensis]MDJ1132608.1 hypothetical protein [Streptomyces iconiensis]